MLNPKVLGRLVYLSAYRRLCLFWPWLPLPLPPRGLLFFLVLHKKQRRQFQLLKVIMIGTNIPHSDYEKLTCWDHASSPKVLQEENTFSKSVYMRYRSYHS
jgi:hypothetical protein